MRNSALVVVLCLATSTCSLIPQPPKIEGDTLTLPRSCMIAKIHEYNGQPSSTFTKWDGNYPKGWPDLIVLPPDTYMMDGPQIKPDWVSTVPGSDPNSELGHYKDVKDYRDGDLISYSIKGVTKGTPAALKEKFEGYVSALNLVGNRFYNDYAKIIPPSKRHGLPLMPNAWGYASVPPINYSTHPRVWGVQYVITDDKTIAGWTYFTLSVQLR